MVVFSFMGSEIVTLAAGEAENPRAAVTKATNSVMTPSPPPKGL